MTLVVDNSVLANGLSVLPGNRTLRALNAQPTRGMTITALDAITVGSVSVTVGAVADGADASVQQRVSVGAGAGGTVPTGDDASFFSLDDATTMLIGNDLAAIQTLVAGVPFTTPAFDIFYSTPT